MVADDDLPQIEIVHDGPVAFAVLRNRPRRNAISVGMWRELEDFAVSISADPTIRAVAFRGADGVFSAGADISGFEADRADAEGARSYDDQLELSCRAIEAVRQPTVACLEGPVIGAGAALAAACDLRIARDDAFLMVPAARLGLGYDPRGIARLTRIFGEPTARWLLLTAGQLPVQRAFVAGAVHEVQPEQSLEEALERLLARLVDNAPLTLAAAKLAFRALADGAEPTMMDEAWQLVDLADASADYVEGRAAFRDKRAPTFLGR